MYTNSPPLYYCFRTDNGILNSPKTNQERSVGGAKRHFFFLEGGGNETVFSLTVFKKKKAQPLHYSRQKFCWRKIVLMGTCFVIAFEGLTIEEKTRGLLHQSRFVSLAEGPLPIP